jgi:hypothetical protein
MALKHFSWPWVGCVTTTFWASKILPPPTGMSLTLPRLELAAPPPELPVGVFAEPPVGVFVEPSPDVLEPDPPEQAASADAAATVPSPASTVRRDVRLAMTA